MGCILQRPGIREPSRQRLRPQGTADLVLVRAGRPGGREARAGGPHHPVDDRGAPQQVPCRLRRGRALGVRVCEDAGLDPTRFPTVVTGSGGLHVYMIKPDGASTRDSLPAYEGIEFKSRGRQVVAAGSVHPATKGVYLWDATKPCLDVFGPDVAPSRLLGLIARPDGAAATGVPDAVSRGRHHRARCRNAGADLAEHGCSLAQCRRRPGGSAPHHRRRDRGCGDGGRGGRGDGCYQGGVRDGNRTAMRFVHGCARVQTANVLILRNYERKHGFCTLNQRQPGKISTGSNLSL
ncbi:MAG TPA: hypothetical protein DC061_06360 [Gemmobacter sp.]|nr:hypothetical protein [Gemmobacter sp.]